MRSKRAGETAEAPKPAKAGVRPTEQAKAAMKPRSVSPGRKPMPVARNKKGVKLSSGVEGQKLRCRYCGSDDLAPSFRKRRDARCRACFKQRYGTRSRKKNQPAPKAPVQAK